MRFSAMTRRATAGRPGGKSEVTLSRNVRDLGKIIDILEKDKRLRLEHLTVIGHSLGGLRR